MREAQACESGSGEGGRGAWLRGIDALVASWIGERECIERLACGQRDDDPMRSRRRCARMRDEIAVGAGLKMTGCVALCVMRA